MRDLKEIVKDLRERGELIDLTDLTLRKELEPTKHLIEADRLGKALLFRIEGFEGVCLGNVLNSRTRLYRLMGVGSDEEAYRKLLNAKPSESFAEEDFRDYFREYEGTLDSLPALKFYRKDGGRYFTSSMVIAELPDMRGSYNASIHRLMLVKDGLAIRIVPRQLYRAYELNRREGRETPIAIVFGPHPVAFLLAACSLPYGVFELSLFRDLTGEELRVVRTPKYGLPVPAQSSVVIEGRLTAELVNEGPFVDLLNLYDRVRKQPLVKIEGIYVSTHSIPFHVVLPGGKEHKLVMGFPREASIWDAVRRAVPKVGKVRLTFGGGGWLHAVISIDKNSDGDGKVAIAAAFGAHPSLKHVVVVDLDIDPDNLAEVEWAIATRFQASKDLVVITDARGSTLDPSSRDGLGDKMGLDATTPVKEREKYRKPEY